MKKWRGVEDCNRELDSLPNDRRIRILVCHHTWRPAVRDWYGDRSAQGILDYWIRTKPRNWTHDAGAHFIVAPDGEIYLPRPLSAWLNSSSNTDANRYGIAVECVGNFDKGHDTLGPNQAHAVIGLFAGLCVTFGLGVDAIHYHCDYSRDKTCPGSAFMPRSAFRERVRLAIPWANGIIR